MIFEFCNPDDSGGYSHGSFIVIFDVENQVFSGFENTYSKSDNTYFALRGDFRISSDTYGSGFCYFENITAGIATFRIIKGERAIPTFNIYAFGGI